MRHLAKLVAAVVLLAPRLASAETEEPSDPSPPPASTFRPNAPSLAVNVGLIQPVMLGGANLEADFRYGPFVAAYSHGWGLDLDSDAIGGAMKRQGVSLHIPFTTGVGVGLTHWFSAANSFVDVRLEAKLHRFEASYGSRDGASKTEIARYNTATLGGGVYWTYLPFASRTDILRGLDISTSVRFWPNVTSTLDNGRKTYASTRTGKTETLEAANIGIGNTPLIVNVSIGYVFQ